MWSSGSFCKMENRRCSPLLLPAAEVGREGLPLTVEQGKSPCLPLCLAAMDESLRSELLAMAAEDQRVRAELAADGSPFEGYRPRMEAIEGHGRPGPGRRKTGTCPPGC
jgi:hypothetical protein